MKQRPAKRGSTGGHALLAVSDQRTAYARWRQGQEAAARRQQELLVSEGARPEVAIAESQAAANALERMSGWPAERDLVAEQGVATVRRRWARIQKRARHARQA